MGRMRLWSLHPMYLDARGLVALWREGLLARAVLRGETKGYRSHPQLLRFRAQPEPLAALDAYLEGVLAEAQRRGYRFDSAKIQSGLKPLPIEVACGQLRYEWEHLLCKLQRRDIQRYTTLASLADPQPHPLFTVVAGGIAAWEKLPPAGK